MKIGKRIMYDTMNGWNNEKSLAYNLKIYNVIRKDLQDKAYDFLSDENISCELFVGIDELIQEFTKNCKYEYTAGFNGRQGGYLVLYKSCRVRNYQTGAEKLETYTHGLDEKDISGNIKRLFHKLAQDIVNYAEQFLSSYDIVEREIMIPKKIKTLQIKGE